MGHIKKTLSDYAKNKPLRLHMPGHKGLLSSLDNTEIPQTDDINNPESSYKKSLAFVRDIYKSSKSFFITSGTTLGIQAMVLYAKKNGYKVIAMRNSHMSVMNACFMFEAEHEFLTPEYDTLTCTYKSHSEAIVKYLKETREKCVVIVTVPDYFGRCADILEIKETANQNGSLVFCDQAHGSHFVYSESLPQNAAEFCDLWVNGAHKTIGALTQGAFVHCSANIDANMFGSILRALNTSSPSHLIASSLEEAVIYSMGKKWDKRASQCKELEENINFLKNIKCVGLDWAQKSDFKEKDVTRIVIDAQNAGGGFYLYKKLYNDFNIQLEMADFRYAVAIMTIYDEKKCDQKFLNALKKLDERKNGIKIPSIPEPGAQKAPTNKSWLEKVKYVSLDDAKGKISASVLGAYPPGTALILPGEVIFKRTYRVF